MREVSAGVWREFRWSKIGIRFSRECIAGGRLVVVFVCLDGIRPIPHVLWAFATVCRVGWLSRGTGNVAIRGLLGLFRAKHEGGARAKSVRTTCAGLRCVGGSVGLTRGLGLRLYSRCVFEMRRGMQDSLMYGQGRARPLSARNSVDDDSIGTGFIGALATCQVGSTNHRPSVPSHHVVSLILTDEDALLLSTTYYTGLCLVAFQG